jgi:hypothetical protein
MDKLATQVACAVKLFVVATNVTKTEAQLRGAIGSLNRVPF